VSAALSEQQLAEAAGDPYAETCPACGSDDYGPLDMGWPFGRPEWRLNPSDSWIVGVCCACGYVTETDTEGGAS
jgi:hypothetical protein